MQAVVLHEHGGPEVLVSERIEQPEPGPGEVRVAVKAVAINHLDIWVRKGGPAFHLEYPHRLGADIAGVVDAFGPGAGDGAFSVGDRVVVNPGISCGRCQACLSGDDNLCRHYHIMGESTQGGYAEYAVVPRQNLVPFPGERSFEEASATLLPFLTAWQMLVRKARIRPGELVLVQGAGSGVGVAAVQICKLFGARVIATAGTNDKLDKARELGADETVNYRERDFVAEVRGLTDKRGVDVVFEHVGGDTFAKSIKITRNGGRIVTCGATSGFTPAIDLRHVFFRQIQILGSTMGSKGDLFEVLRHVESGALKPVIHTVMPLAKAGEAHSLLEDRAAFGKVVLTP
ncbi:zinc-binding dehydrogenase [Haliangium sp.]|uniref:zinc-binding dehydrogenase n=1 Tax=Haliangium sp. TaxID=2663208 RepID=UPI003D13A66F